MSIILFYWKISQTFFRFRKPPGTSDHSPLVDRQCSAVRIENQIIRLLLHDFTNDQPIYLRIKTILYVICILKFNEKERSPSTKSLWIYLTKIIIILIGINSLNNDSMLWIEFRSSKLVYNYFSVICLWRKNSEQ